MAHQTLAILKIKIEITLLCFGRFPPKLVGMCQTSGRHDSPSLISNVLKVALLCKIRSMF